MTTVLTLLIRFYQVSISHIFGGCCRFHPSCSEYALQAIRLHGSIKGSALAAVRLSKCHPLHRGGFDPVPATVDGERGGGLEQVGAMNSTCEVRRIQ
ncbi:MAG: membrane protein insertion efficiency factor YidD [bacterium]